MASYITQYTGQSTSLMALLLDFRRTSPSVRNQAYTQITNYVSCTTREISKIIKKKSKFTKKPNM